MFLHLTERIGNYKTRIYIGFGVLAATWLAVTLSLLLGCAPIYKYWQIYPDPGLNCQPAVSRINVFVTLCLNVVSDLYLLTIPLPMLWATTIKPRKKIGLMVLFSGGIFVMLAGILRCVLILGNDVTGALDGSAWAVRECFVTVVTSNFPAIIPIFRTWLGPWISSSSSRKGGNSNRTGVQPGSIWKGRDKELYNEGTVAIFAVGQETILDMPADAIKVERHIKISTDLKSYSRHSESDSDCY